MRTIFKKFYSTQLLYQVFSYGKQVFSILEEQSWKLRVLCSIADFHYLVGVFPGVSTHCLNASISLAVK